MKIAIIGSGIAGLSAAYSLMDKHEVTVFETNSRAGGHSRTINIDVNGKNESIDTGFIVFNDRNYPILRRFFSHLNIPYEKSDMSFGVSAQNGQIEYSSSNVFAQPRNILRPSFWRMIFDILRFNKTAQKWVGTDLTLGDMLREFNGRKWFNNYYIKPMGAAIWSCSTTTIEDFPASAFIRFFHNHGLLTIFKQPQWFTVTNGSKTYVDKVTSRLGTRLKLNCAITKITAGKKPTVTDETGLTYEFDKVILACHADQALGLMDQPSPEQTSILGAFSFQTNNIIVHSDESFMPRRKSAWASWVYLNDHNNSLCLSYWMNNLQNKDKSTSIIETLNPIKRPAEDLIHDEYTFSHPVFTKQAIEAQKNLDKIQGQGNLYYCGAWSKNGFHEDGIASAVHVLNLMGEPISWL